jgi:hypothetical protein
MKYPRSFLTTDFTDNTDREQVFSAADFSSVQSVKSAVKTVRPAR